MCFSGVLENIIVLFWQTTALCRFPRADIASMARWNVYGAFSIPDGIRMNRYKQWLNVKNGFMLFFVVYLHMIVFAVLVGVKKTVNFFDEFIFQPCSKWGINLGRVLLLILPNEHRIVRHRHLPMQTKCMQSIRLWIFCWLPIQGSMRFQRAEIRRPSVQHRNMRNVWLIL